MTGILASQNKFGSVLSLSCLLEKFEEYWYSSLNVW
jgi:hypothetical protein